MITNETVYARIEIFDASFFNNPDKRQESQALECATGELFVKSFHEGYKNFSTGPAGPQGLDGLDLDETYKAFPQPERLDRFLRDAYIDIMHELKSSAYRICMVVAREKTGNLVGVCFFDMRHYEKDRGVYLAQMATFPYGRGIGKLMLQKFLETFPSSFLYLFARKINEYAISAYQHMGFHGSGTEEGFSEDTAQWYLKLYEYNPAKYKVFLNPRPMLLLSPDQLKSLGTADVPQNMDDHNESVDEETPCLRMPGASK